MLAQHRLKFQRMDLLDQYAAVKIQAAWRGRTGRLQVSGIDGLRVCASVRSVSVHSHRGMG